MHGIAQFQISGYPTILVFPGGKKTPKNFVKYEGARTAAAIQQHALGLLHDKHVIKVIIIHHFVFVLVYSLFCLYHS
jgi:hypothetical protein